MSGRDSVARYTSGISSNVLVNYEEYYNARYTSQEREWRRKSAVGKATNIMNLCRDIPHSTVLEIGSGDGAVLQELHRAGFGSSLYSLEVTRNAVNHNRLRGLNTLTDSVLYDGYHVPYQDQCFDLVILTHVVEHLEHPRMLLKEAARVGRYLYVEVPLEHTMFLESNYVPNHVGHIDVYSHATIRRVLQSCRLSVLAQTVTNRRLDIYSHIHGKKGLLLFLCTQSMLRLCPPLAMKFFVYDCSLLCKRQ